LPNNPPESLTMFCNLLRLGLLVLCSITWLPAAGCRSTSIPHAIPDPGDAWMATSIDAGCYAQCSAVTSSAALPEFSGPQHVETLIAWAVAQNPAIEAARKQMEAASYRIPQAASLEDPMLEVNPFLAPMGMGDMEQVIQMGVSQQIPWSGKLPSRAEVAAHEAQRARAQWAAAELAVIEQVKIAYYQLYFVQQAIRISQADRELLLALQEIAAARFRVGQVNQQDVLRAELEVLELDNQLVRLQQELDTARARLARQLSISPDTPLDAVEQLPDEQIPEDLQHLYDLAIAARPELQAQLAEISRARQNVDLARLNYFPDVRLSAMWMGMDMPGNGMNTTMNSSGDALLLGIGVNLPIYRQRLDAGVREAEAQAVASARQYDVLRDRTHEEVADLFAQIRSQQELSRLLREEIVPKAEQTFEVSLRAYEVGEVTFLQLVDNWRQLLRYQITTHQLEAQLRQSLARLERLLGGHAYQPTPTAVDDAADPGHP
jgi:outer membrane protein, heavy metal efflux system